MTLCSFILEKQKHIRIEKIKLLYQHSLTPIILGTVAGLFLMAALWPSANHQHLVIWFIINVIFTCVRILLILKFRQKNPQDDDVLQWKKPYSISLLTVFLLWGIGLIWVMPKDNLSAVFIINTFSIGLAGAAISWYSPLRYLQISTISLALIPMIFILLTGARGNLLGGHCRVLPVGFVHGHQPCCCKKPLMAI